MTDRTDKSRSGPDVSSPSHIGLSISRVDAEDKVRGTARYVDDLAFPDMLHAAFVLPGVAHARLEGIDPAPALKMPGIHAVVTAADVPGENQVGCVDKDQPLLPEDRIRYTGDAVAVVVADTPALAREAALAVRVDLVELPAVFDAKDAMGPDAPLVHSGGNVFLHFKVRKGDVTKGFEEADVVIERVFHTYHQEHSYLEPLGTIAVPEEGGSMTIYGTMQCPYYVQKAVATVLDLPLSRVRVRQTVTGGGFGGKEDMPSEICACAALAAWKTGRPVKLIHTREEDFYRSSKRHPMSVSFKLGATTDGRFTAAEIRVVADAGAYSTLSPVVIFRTTTHATGPYEISNVKTDAYGVYTNRQTTGAFRGFGQPQTIFANESVVDEMAERLGMDPVEIRLKNCLTVGKRTATGQLLTESVGLPDTLEKARDVSGWVEKRRSYAGDDGRIRRGIGIGSIYYGVSLGAKGLLLDASGAHLNVYRDGSVRIAVGGTEMGQGLLTVLSQIAADSLGAPIESIHVDHVDTSVVPDSGPSVASRTTLMTGNAVIDAATKLKATMGEVAADMLGVSRDSIEFRDGRVLGGDGSLTFADLANECWLRNINTAADGWYAAPESTFDENGQGDAYAVYSYATHVAEVEVDTETGEIHLVRVTAAHDVGRILNPVTLEGQIEGGVLQSAGMGLYEKMKTNGGDIITPDFSTYIIPTAMDVPEIESVFIEARYSMGPFGAKGIGETPAMPGAVAIANAVTHATGIRFHELPVTAEAVRLALSRRIDS
jgi:CO/xanthine dehydrogenase Mo-binding subunit